MSISKTIPFTVLFNFYGKSKVWVTTILSKTFYVFKYCGYILGVLYNWEWLLFFFCILLFCHFMEIVIKLTNHFLCFFVAEKNPFIFTFATPDKWIHIQEVIFCMYSWRIFDFWLILLNILNYSSSRHE